MKSSLLILFLFIVFVGCDESRVYEKHQSPAAELEWSSKDTIGFYVDIADTLSTYDLIFALRYAQGFPVSNLKVEMQHQLPDGSQRFQMHDITVSDASGNYMGKGLGDIWDLEQTIISGLKFKQKGIHTFRFAPSMSIDPVPLVMEVGLVVKTVGEL